MRGNAMSLAPICSGTRKLARPISIGIAKRKTIVVPCIEKTWSYCSGVSTCMPGRMSCVFMTIAMPTAQRKNARPVHR